MSNQDYFTEFRKTFVATVREKLQAHNKLTGNYHNKLMSVQNIFQYIYANTGNLFMYCMIDFVNAYTSKKMIDTFYRKVIEMHNESYKYELIQSVTTYGEFRELCKSLIVVLKIMYKTLYKENIEQIYPEELADRNPKQEREDALEKRKALFVGLRRSPRIAAKNNNNNIIEPVALRRSARLAAKNR